MPSTEKYPRRSGATLSRRDFVRTSVLASAAALAAQSKLFGQAAVETLTTRGLRFGANYTPRKNWWYCWLDWDQQAILDDLSGIAALGLDHIRIPCLWSLFQPGISNVSERSLANLHSLLDAADGAGLDVEVTVLNGWMSGLSFLPAWTMPLARTVDGDNFNIFTSRAVIDAEKMLFRKIAETIGGHRRFLGFDIGNELGVLLEMNNPATSAAADAWATEILAYCDQIAPGKFHVNGADHSHWFNDFGFTRPNLATTGHATVMHSYIYFDGIYGRYKYDDPASLHLASYEIEWAYAFHKDLSRRVWIQETGMSSKEMPPTYKPVFMEHSVRNMAATGKTWGVTWWCSHDMDRAVKGFGEYEYELGLIDLQNKPKPMGKKFKELAAELRRSPPVVSPQDTALVVPDLGLSAKSWPPDFRFAKPYMELVEAGQSPAIVLASRSTDEAYLKARGIKKLVPCVC